MSMITDTNQGPTGSTYQSVVCVCVCVCDLLCVLEGWDDTEGVVNSSSVSRGDHGRQSALSCMFVAIIVSCSKASASLIHTSSQNFISHNQATSPKCPWMNFYGCRLQHIDYVINCVLTWLGTSCPSQAAPSSWSSSSGNSWSFCGSSLSSLQFWVSVSTWVDVLPLRFGRQAAELNNMPC